jgi:hypothetical protein
VTFRLALDQNFPLRLVKAIEDAAPAGIQMQSLHDIDIRLGTLSDRQLIIALSQLGFDALASNDLRTLDTPEELGALLATRLGFVAIKSAGHNPVKATGALLLELSNLPQVFSDPKRRILELRFDPRKPTDGWEYLTKVASRSGLTAHELYEQVRPTEAELTAPVLV